jgi:hypothetical protein
MSEFPQPSGIRIELGYQAECPECRAWIDIDSTEEYLGVTAGGDDLGYHTEPDLARYFEHYAEVHGS